jgi:hypothetical protein
MIPEKLEPGKLYKIKRDSNDMGFEFYNPLNKTVEYCKIGDCVLYLGRETWETKLPEFYFLKDGIKLVPYRLRVRYRMLDYFELYQYEI